MKKTIEDIFELAVESPQSLPEVLMYARWLAAKIDYQPFTDWVAHELGGYPSPVEAPAYRVIRGHLRGEFSAYPLPSEDSAVPHSVLGGRLREEIENVRLFQSVSRLISLRDDGNTFFAVPIEQEALQLINSKYRPDHRFLNLRIQIPAGAIGGVLADTRQQIVAALAELSTKYPTIEVYERAAQDGEQDITRIVNENLMVDHVENLYWGQNQVAVDQSRTTIQIIHAGDWASLDAFLMSRSIPDDKRDELRTILDPIVEDPDADNKAEGLRAWLDEAADQLSSGATDALKDASKKAATESLVDAIRSYAPAVARIAWVASLSVGQRLISGQ